MTPLAERILKEAQDLNQDERLALAGKLVESVRLEAEICAEHLEIARQRAAEVETGS